MKMTPSIASNSSGCCNTVCNKQASLSTCDTSFNYNTIIISDEKNTSSGNVQPLFYTVSNQEITSNACNAIQIMDIEPVTSCDNSHTSNVVTDSRNDIIIPSTMHLEASDTFELSNTRKASNTKYEPSNCSEVSKTSSPEKHCTPNFATLFSWTG